MGIFEPIVETFFLYKFWHPYQKDNKLYVGVKWHKPLFKQLLNLFAIL